MEQPTLQGPGPLPRARAGPLVSLQLFVTEGYEQRQTGPCAITADNRVYVEVSLPSYVCVFNCVSVCLSVCLSAYLGAFWLEEVISLTSRENVCLSGVPVSPNVHPH